MNQKPKRLYEPIWDQLKLTQFCATEVPKHLHARVLKAVTKEKNIDVAFKDLMDSHNRTFVLETRIENKIMIFRLVARFGVQDL